MIFQYDKLNKKRETFPPNSHTLAWLTIPITFKHYNDQLLVSEFVLIHILCTYLYIVHVILLLCKAAKLCIIEEVYIKLPPPKRPPPKK